jgi:hypothetical protein
VHRVSHSGARAPGCGAQRAVSELRFRAQSARPDGHRVRRECGAATFIRTVRSLRALGCLQRPSVVHGLPVWLGKPALEAFAAIPLRRSRAASRGLEVDLSELCERLRLEILYAFQLIWLDGGYVWEGTRRLQGLIDALVRVDAECCWSATRRGAGWWLCFTGGCGHRSSGCSPTRNESSSGTCGGSGCCARTAAVRRSTTPRSRSHGCENWSRAGIDSGWSRTALASATRRAGGDRALERASAAAGRR